MAIIRMMASGEVLEQILHGLVAGALLALPMQGIALRKLYLLQLYPAGDNLPCLFGLHAGSGRALHALAALSVIAWYDGSSQRMSMRLLICFSGVLPMRLSTSSSLLSVPAFSFTMFSSFSSPFSEGRVGKYLRVC